MIEQTLDRIIEKHNGSKGGLISILEDIQSAYGYLSEDALKLVAVKTGQSLVDVYGTATFYKSFSLKPRGKHLCSVCTGTACHVRGAPKVSQEFQKQLNVKHGETTADKEFTLETVNCLGACALGPIVVVDGHYFSNVKTTQVGGIIKKSSNGLDKIEVDSDQCCFPVEVSCPRCNHSLLDSKTPIDGYPSVRFTVSSGRQHGCLRISSLYGSYAVLSDVDIPLDSLVNVFCPHCHAELKGYSECPDCGAPMVPLLVRGGGMIQICSRRGCRGHQLDIEGINL